MGRYIAIKAGAKSIQLPDGTVRSAGAGKNIVSSTNASPTVVTMAAGHGLVTGDLVYISGHLVNTNLNGFRKVTVTNDTFTAVDANTNVAVNGNGVGVATGTVREDIVTLTDAQFQALSPNAIDGDPLVNLGLAPTVDGDAVITQGVEVDVLATGSTAVGYAALGAAGAAPDAGEFETFETAMDTFSDAVVADLLSIKVKLNVLIEALEGSGKALVDND